MIAIQEEDEALPRWFEDKYQTVKYLIEDLKHDELKLIYLKCREAITDNLKKLERMEIAREF